LARPSGRARAVSVERIVPAPAAAIFDVLADPAMHPVIDGSGTVRAPLPGNPVRLALGARFGMAMRIVGNYRMTNEVVEFEEGRRIAWCHIGGARWRYELTPAPAGTLVRETFDYSQTTVPLLPVVFVLGRFPERNRVGMATTLERLAGLVSAGGPGGRSEAAR
jgi:uncharacterized protein YndB with AHSA1/START domain